MYELTSQKLSVFLHAIEGESFPFAGTTHFTNALPLKSVTGV
jgi:hypothetical protein